MNTDAAIIGGSPAALMLAIELGCRDVKTVLPEEDSVGPSFPTNVGVAGHQSRHAWVEAAEHIRISLTVLLHNVQRRAICMVPNSY